MLVPMQRQNRPDVPPKVRVMMAWAIWGAMIASMGMFYFVGWQVPRTQTPPGDLPLTVFAGLSTGLFVISLGLMSYRRQRVTDLQKKFTFLVIGCAIAESGALQGLVLRFTNSAPDQAIYFLLASLAVMILQNPSDFKASAPPPPGSREDLGLPPPIG